MSKITIDRAVVERAMEALEWHYRQGHSNTLGGFRLKIDEKALRELSAALAQQGEPVEPAYKVEIAGRWHDTEPLAPAFSLPDGEHLLYTAPRKAEPVLQALRNLVSVCQRMDLEHQAERPSEAEYQTAMQAAQAAIQAVEGAA